MPRIVPHMDLARERSAHTNALPNFGKEITLQIEAIDDQLVSGGFNLEGAGLQISDSGVDAQSGGRRALSQNPDRRRGRIHRDHIPPQGREIKSIPPRPAGQIERSPGTHQFRYLRQKKRWREVQVFRLGVVLFPIAWHVSRLLCSLMRIVVLVGLPGSGKSTYLERIGSAPLSSDVIRKLLADDETDQTIHEQVFQTLRYLLRHRLALKRPVTYIDATNLTVEERQPYIGIGRSYGCRMEALYFDVPLDVCRERNALRHRIVPDDAMARMAAKLTAPSEAEGFDRVTTADGVRP